MSACRKIRDVSHFSKLKNRNVPIFLTAVGLACVSLAAWAEPRTAKVAGAFYPEDPRELRPLVTQLLEQHPDASTTKPRILISPHAGYPYSGIVAARSFREVQGQSYDVVIVVGFTHRDQFDGASVDDRESYQTPLGTIPVDTEAVAFLKTWPKLDYVERAHDSQEHSLEVMLPFLQVALGEFRLVPILMGSVDYTDAQFLADALAALAKRHDALFVFSTDLSHYHPYEEAMRRDERTVNALLFETPQAADRLFSLGYLEACGRGPIVTSLLLAQRLGYPQRRLLAYANSGDTAGEKSRVVGYAALGMYDHPSLPPEEAISREAGMALVKAARLVLDMHLRPSRYENRLISLGLDEAPELTRARGLFVTLRKHGQLRGCIGRIRNTDTPLAHLLPTVALDAALRDARFPPLSAEELDEVTVEVSVLSPPQPVQRPEELVAGRDGVVLEKDGNSGVFLPQVWTETGWTRGEFLQELARQKAGLAPDAWQEAQLFTFQDQVFEEESASPSVTPH